MLAVAPGYVIVGQTHCVGEAEKSKAVSLWSRFVRTWGENQKKWMKGWLLDLHEIGEKMIRQLTINEIEQSKYLITNFYISIFNVFDSTYFQADDDT